MGWTLTEVNGVPLTDDAWITFLPGPRAEGRIKSDCSFLSFDYTYDPSVSTIQLVEGDGSYTEGCSAAALALYARTRAALPRVVAWRMPVPERFELLDVGGATLFEGRPLPALPTAPPVGDCGSVAPAPCAEAATQAFNFGLFLTPGQRVVAWRVRDTIYSFCGGALTPRFDVIFELENPTFEKVATVGELYGKLHACGDY